MSGGRMMMWAVLVLWIAVLATALLTVHTRHDIRRLFVELQQLEHERDELEIEWGRLRIEQGTWSTHARVEALARERLGMIVPEPAHVEIVRP